jgi:uncharacterized membrane protein YbhN (UPF0104 family)
MNRTLKAILKILLSAAALYYVFTRIDIEDVINIFRSVNYILLALALIFFVLSKLVSAWRLNYYFDKADVKLENKSNLRLYLLGMYYNLFLPGGIGGDGYKIWLLSKNFNTSAKPVFWGVFLDRINGVFALYLLALLLVPFLEVPGFYTVIALSLIPLSTILYVVVNKKFFNKFYPVIVPTTLLSLVVQVLQVISAVFILFAIDTFDHITAYVFLFLVSSIVAALPITIGGIGSREITFLFGANILLLDINQSIALSLLFYVITLVVSITGIYFSLNPGAMKIERFQDHGNINLNTSE